MTSVSPAADQPIIVWRAAVPKPKKSAFETRMAKAARRFDPEPPPPPPAKPPAPMHIAGMPIFSVALSLLVIVILILAGVVAVLLRR